MYVNCAINASSWTFDMFKDLKFIRLRETSKNLVFAHVIRKTIRQKDYTEDVVYEIFINDASLWASRRFEVFLACAESFRILDAIFFLDSHLISSKLIQITSHLIKIIKTAICYHDFSKRTTFRIIKSSIWSLNEMLNWWIAFSLWLIAFWNEDSSLYWNENSSLFEMKTRRFFSLTHLDHHITLYNIYDHRWVSILHTSDDMQENFLICMKIDQKIVFEFFHTDEKIFLNVIKCIRNRHSTMIVCIIESDVMIEMSQREKAMNSHFKKRWVLIWKSDKFSFEKAMNSHLKKRWVFI
jgi:hypothetical protein